MSPFIPEVIFPSHRILGWHFFSFRAWKMPCLFLLVSAVSDEKATVIRIVSPLSARCRFQLAVLKTFSLVFKSLIMIYLGMDFFGFNLCGVYSASWLYKFMSFAIFGSFLAIISFNTFSVPPFLHLLISVVTQILIFCCSPTGPQRSVSLCICLVCLFSKLFLAVVQIGHFYWPFFCC